MPMHERVLIVEDDAAVRETASLLLERSGFVPSAVADGAAALEEVERRQYDLIVLDVMLPTVNGFDVCREIRRTSQVPIIMLTARTDITDVVAGLELGADDYVTKPFEGAELVARARAVLRRKDPMAPVADTVTIADLVIEPDSYQVERNGNRLDLTTTEFRLLLELVRRAGQILSREALLERVWGYDFLGDSRLVDMAVKRLRDKLGDDPREPRYIATVRGMGYRFERG
jgi:two-component system, OmpR family, response regulator MtrA